MVAAALRCPPRRTQGDQQTGSCHKACQDRSSPEFVRCVFGCRVGLCEHIAHKFLGVRLLPATTSVDGLLGHEGAATARFWRAWSALLLHGFNLPVRCSETPGPVAIALNMAASLLARDMVAIVSARGQHPCFGILHGVTDGQDGCVYNLV